jgi:hypothetical protein
MSDRTDPAPERAPQPPPERHTEAEAPPDATPQEGVTERPETARRPAPGVRHEPEPDGRNIVPREDGPGTL